MSRRWAKYRQGPNSKGVPFPPYDEHAIGNRIFTVSVSIRENFDWRTGFEKDILGEIEDFLERIDAGYHEQFLKGPQRISATDSYLAVLLTHPRGLPSGWIEVHIEQYDEQTMVGCGYLYRKATYLERMLWRRGSERAPRVMPESEPGHDRNEETPF